MPNKRKSKRWKNAYEEYLAAQYLRAQEDGNAVLMQWILGEVSRVSVYYEVMEEYDGLDD